jgi:CheY-like chemotaxis protein
MEVLMRIRVLLVEDDAVIAMGERKALAKRGYEIVHAASAEEALAYVGGSRDSFDLVLMDVNLGEGMDGIVAAHEMRKTCEVPLVFLTSHSESEIVARAQGLTSWEFVSKERGIEAVDKAMRNAMGRLEP